MPIFLAMTVHLFSLLQMKADAVTEMSRLLPEAQNRYCVSFNECAYFISAKYTFDIETCGRVTRC